MKSTRWIKSEIEHGSIISMWYDRWFIIEVSRPYQKTLTSPEFYRPIIRIVGTTPTKLLSKLEKWLAEESKIVLPKMVNNECVQKLPDKLLGLADQWLAELAPKNGEKDGKDK